MLYKNKYGRIIDEGELSLMNAMDIEEQGIHMADQWAWEDN